MNARGIREGWFGVGLCLSVLLGSCKGEGEQVTERGIPEQAAVAPKPATASPPPPAASPEPGAAGRDTARSSGSSPPRGAADLRNDLYGFDGDHGERVTPLADESTVAGVAGSSPAGATPKTTARSAPRSRPAQASGAPRPSSGSGLAAGATPSRSSKAAPGPVTSPGVGLSNGLTRGIASEKEVRSAPAPARGEPDLLSRMREAEENKRRRERERQRQLEREEEARRAALARAQQNDEARRNDDARLPFVPRHDADDRFPELRVLRRSSIPDMVFYDYGVNPTISARQERTSTFAVDVDSASYTVARSYLQRGVMPDEAAIRVEEMVNAFDYAYAAPTEEPFLVQAEAFPSPNRKGYHVLHLGLKGRDPGPAERKPAALAYVIDVSGSMQGDERLGLVQRSLAMLTRNLDGRDSVGIVVYGSTARTLVEPTYTTENGKERILDALAGLSTEGSTNVEAGLMLGYDLVSRFAGRGTTTRVILCSDGVANTGATEAEAILRRVAEHAARGVTISTVGFGMGNYNDVLMERLADKGNGNYAYVDTLEAAQRIFVDQLGATLDVIAKDVKIQVAFDPQAVDRYRLLGFENRMLDKRDFANDRVDAGEVGAGHTVTAMYEVKLRSPEGGGSLGDLRVRYKEPTGSASRLIEKQVPASIVRGSFAAASAPTKLSLVVAAFAEKLRGSYWARNQSYQDILALWDQLPATLKYRQDVAELRTLITTAHSLDRRGDRFQALLPVAKMDFDRVPVLY